MVEYGTQRKAHLRGEWTSQHQVWLATIPDPVLTASDLVERLLVGNLSVSEQEELNKRNVSITVTYTSRTLLPLIALIPS